MSGKKLMSDEIGLQRAQLSGVNLKKVWLTNVWKLKGSR